MLQHIVPQTYLRRFSEKDGDSHFVFVYDKTNRRFLKSNVNRIAARNDFYRLELLENKNAWENALSKMEQQLALVLSSVIGTADLNVLDNNAVVIDPVIRVKLAIHIMMQVYRGIAVADYEKSIRDNLREGIRHEVYDLAKQFYESDKEMDVDAYLNNDDLWRLAFARQLMDLNSHRSIVAKLYYRKWLLFKTTEHSFITSDAPVVFYNYMYDEIGELKAGMGVDSTVIYYPISSRLLLGLYPSGFLLGYIEKYDGTIVRLSNSDSFIYQMNRLQLRQCNRQIYAREPENLRNLFDDQD